MSNDSHSRPRSGTRMGFEQIVRQYVEVGLVEGQAPPYMRTRDSVHRKNSPFFGPQHFR
jgi:hypothetical protein